MPTPTTRVGMAPRFQCRSEEVIVFSVLSAIELEGQEWGIVIFVCHSE